VTFAEELFALQDVLGTCEVAHLHLQTKLPEDEQEAFSVAHEMTSRWVAQGAEGSILRNPGAFYEVKRSKSLLKLKPSSDDEGTLVGFTAGRGKYVGMIGALILDYNGKRLELSGLTDEERLFDQAYTGLTPGKDVPSHCRAKHFKIGQQITFLYRELSDSLIPKEARYLRVRHPE
jgi:DNA ligase-1